MMLRTRVWIVKFIANLSRNTHILLITLSKVILQYKWIYSIIYDLFVSFSSYWAHALTVLGFLVLPCRDNLTVEYVKNQSLLCTWAIIRAQNNSTCEWCRTHLRSIHTKENRCCFKLINKTAPLRITSVDLCPPPLKSALILFVNKSLFTVILLIC